MLKRIINKAIELNSNVLPIAWHLKLSGRKLFIPFYHLVSNEEVAHIKNIFSYPNEKRFLQDLDFFGKHFQFISLDEINKKCQKPAIHLTFDDGLRECYQVVAPILKKKGIPATFFINTDFLDNKKMFFRNKISLLLWTFEKNKLAFSKSFDLKTRLSIMKYIPDYKIINEAAELLEVDFSSYLREKKPYMNTTEVLNLKNEGFAIGSHGKNHFQFAELTENEQYSEVVDSCDILRKIFGTNQISFAFPYNSHNVKRSFFEEIQKQDISPTFGTEGLMTDKIPNHFHRFWMENSEKSASFILKSNFKHLFMEKIRGRNFINRE